MDDIVSLFVVFFVFKALGGTLKSLFHGDKRNDFRRDRLGIALSANLIILQGQNILCTFSCADSYGFVDGKRSCIRSHKKNIV